MTRVGKVGEWRGVSKNDNKAKALEHAVDRVYNTTAAAGTGHVLTTQATV